MGLGRLSGIALLFKYSVASSSMMIRTFPAHDRIRNNYKMIAFFIKTFLLFLGPCLNGTCTNTVGNYQCKCTSYSTGKNCNLRKDACAGNPCNKTEICVLSEMHATGYKCLNSDKLIEMKYTKGIGGDGDKFDLEKTIKEVIISAPDNLIANNSSVKSVCRLIR